MTIYATSIDKTEQIVQKIEESFLWCFLFLQEAIETIVASSAMAILKEAEAKQQEAQTPKSKWAKWKRGGIIGAAAVTGGTLMAITGGIMLYLFLRIF